MWSRRYLDALNTDIRPVHLPIASRPDSCLAQLSVPPGKFRQAELANVADPAVWGTLQLRRGQTGVVGMVER